MIMCALTEEASRPQVTAVVKIVLENIVLAIERVDASREPRRVLWYR